MNKLIFISGLCLCFMLIGCDKKIDSFKTEPVYEITGIEQSRYNESYKLITLNCCYPDDLIGEYKIIFLEIKENDMPRWDLKLYDKLKYYEPITFKKYLAKNGSKYSKFSEDPEYIGIPFFRKAR